jgi:hypothetical protein
MSKLITWCHNPDGKPETLEALLEALEEQDLRTLMDLEGPVGRVAWAELGRRRGYANFEYFVRETEHEVTVEIVSEALPAHTFKSN